MLHRLDDDELQNELLRTRLRLDGIREARSKRLAEEKEEDARLSLMDRMRDRQGRRLRRQSRWSAELKAEADAYRTITLLEGELESRRRRAQG